VNELEEMIRQRVAAKQLKEEDLIASG